MNKCKECPFRYIDHRKNWKCRLNSKVVNAYGCEEDLSKFDMLREKQDYIDEVKRVRGKVE